MRIDKERDASAVELQIQFSDHLPAFDCPMYIHTYIHAPLLKRRCPTELAVPQTERLVELADIFRGEASEQR